MIHFYESNSFQNIFASNKNKKLNEITLSHYFITAYFYILM